MNDRSVNKLIIHMLGQEFVDSLHEMYISDEKIHVVFAYKYLARGDMYEFIASNEFFKHFESVCIKNKEKFVALEIVDRYESCDEDAKTGGVG